MVREIGILAGSLIFPSIITRPMYIPMKASSGREVKSVALPFALTPVASMMEKTDAITKIREV
jgi:hypothetical protein